MASEVIFTEFVVTCVLHTARIGFPLGTQIFSLSHARDILNIPSFSFLSELKIYHTSSFIYQVRAVFHLDHYSNPDSMVLLDIEDQVSRIV